MSAPSNQATIWRFGLIVGFVVLYELSLFAVNWLLIRQGVIPSLSQLLAALIGLVFCSTLYLKHKSHAKARTIMTPISPKRLWALSIGCITCLAIAAAIIMGFMGYRDDHLPTWQNIIGFVVIAPIAEELLFRGVVLDELEELLGPTWALTLSTCLFAVAHAQPGRIGYAILAGALFGLVFMLERSVLLVASLHVVNNILALVVQPLQNSVAILFVCIIGFVSIASLLIGKAIRSGMFHCNTDDSI